MPRWNGGVIGAANNPTLTTATGIWSLSEVTKAVRAGLWPLFNAGADPYFNLTTLLLSGDGTNGAQNNTFLDSSTNAFTITRNGNTTQGTFTPFSQTGWSNYFPGIGDYLTVPATSNLEFGSGDFTIEFWWYPTSTGRQFLYHGSIGTDWSIGIDYSSNSSNQRMGVWASSNGSSWDIFNADAGGNGITSAVVPQQQWNHFAWTRSGNIWRAFLNGVQVWTGTSSATIVNRSGSAKGIGTWYAGNNQLSGAHLTNFRIVKGTAVYTSNFTVPTAPLTAIANTQLLTCQSNRFMDNSTNNFTITRNGNVSVQAFSPFAPAGAYSTSTVGGSGYFDGSGDYLTGPTNTATAFNLTGNFTIECFAYFNSVSTAYAGLASWADSSGWNGWQFLNNAGTITFEFLTGSAAAGTVTSSTAVTTGQWYHIAAVRSSSTITLYLNGVSVGTSTYSSSQTSSSSFIKVGADRGATALTTGYISNLRVVNGTAVYTTAFTPPTAPLTAIANTQLLLSGTNGGITDATAKNNLETVGNAQISTTQSKFGGSSMYFDGTGDYLISRSSPTLAFGSGDFTIESWVYVSAHTNADGVVCANWTGTWSANNWSLHSDHGSANEKFSFWAYNYSTSAPILTSTTTVATGTWYHVAVTRNGNSWRLFINGTQEGSTVTSSAALDNGASWPVYISGALSNQVLNGYIDDLRITKGYARYTANFTAPTAPFNGF